MSLQLPPKFIDATYGKTKQCKRCGHIVYMPFHTCVKTISGLKAKTKKNKTTKHK